MQPLSRYYHAKTDVLGSDNGRKIGTGFNDDNTHVCEYVVIEKRKATDTDFDAD